MASSEALHSVYCKFNTMDYLNVQKGEKKEDSCYQHCYLGLLDKR